MRILGAAVSHEQLLHARYALPVRCQLDADFLRLARLLAVQQVVFAVFIGNALRGRP